MRVRDVLRRLGGNCRREHAASRCFLPGPSQSARGKFADHGHILFVAQRHSRRALRVSGICTASRLHLHSCTRVASSSASSSRCLFWRAPPWPSVRLLVSRCWHTRRRKFTPPTPLLDLPSEAASKRRPPPPPCRTSSPGTSRPVASVRLPQLTPGSIAIINSDKVPRAAPPHKNLAWLT